MDKNIRDFYPSVSLFIQEKMALLKMEFYENSYNVINTCHQGHDTYISEDNQCKQAFCSWISSCSMWLDGAQNYVDQLMQMIEEAENLEDPSLVQVEILSETNLYLKQALENLTSYINNGGSGC